MNDLRAEAPLRVAIIGTGSYATALGQRLLSAGVTVVFGSRRSGDGDTDSSLQSSATATAQEQPSNGGSSPPPPPPLQPQSQQSQQSQQPQPQMLHGAPLLGPCAAAARSNVVILAVPLAAHCAMAECLRRTVSNRGVVLIDVSNAPLSSSSSRKSNGGKSKSQRASAAVSPIASRVTSPTPRSSASLSAAAAAARSAARLSGGFGSECTGDMATCGACGGCGDSPAAPAKPVPTSKNSKTPLDDDERRPLLMPTTAGAFTASYNAAHHHHHHQQNGGGANLATNGLLVNPCGGDCNVCATSDDANCSHLHAGQDQDQQGFNSKLTPQLEYERESTAAATESDVYRAQVARASFASSYVVDIEDLRPPKPKPAPAASATGNAKATTAPASAASAVFSPVSLNESEPAHVALDFSASKNTIGHGNKAGYNRLSKSTNSLLADEEVEVAPASDNNIIDGVEEEDENVLSYAERLQRMMPGVDVVKAFNTVSAFALTKSAGERVDDRVLMCGNNSWAKDVVSRLVLAIGMRPVDAGPLIAAREIERRPLQLFNEWHSALWTSLILFVFSYIYVAVRDVYLATPAGGSPAWKDLLFLKFNVVIAWHALALLTLTFCAGVVAALRQLITNTAKKAFPDWLDAWLRARKALGVLGFGSAALHAVAAMMTTSLFIDWAYVESRQGAEYQGAMLAGLFAFALLVCVAVTSQPAVGASLTWREWDFVQSKLGPVALALGTTHALLMSFALGDLPAVDGWNGSYWLPPVSVIAFAPAALVLVLKLATSLPPLAGRLARIRGLAAPPKKKASRDSRSSNRQSQQNLNING
ncbi:hypothetical protein CAOG_07224 [Capsaspora owczarzaki ATCC 30864]|uniref:hypothetical protein n=1 Tax=Capsaspora owczarzaki (strain ATCC 30864) TaxID=595528 RepID=UPI0001FE2C30|nr:hypothetical protein CAOG_07224 [Capsaspora owczarzaki ATCC 30864]|eukprot:XP_004343083.1 hypothetical protein CAOG_07224 [Capsaspora owczarzaki ATCC 30864]